MQMLELLPGNLVPQALGGDDAKLLNELARNKTKKKKEKKGGRSVSERESKHVSEWVTGQPTTSNTRDRRNSTRRLCVRVRACVL